MTEVVFETLRAEFSDAIDAAQLTRIAIRLLLAAALGGALGYERERSGQAAGIRTHMLVAMGAALFVLVPQQAGMAIDGLGRVVQGIVTGVGFLGAGAIIKHRSLETVHGLTTAAGVWMTAAIGVACGFGRETTAVISTVLALVVLVAVPHLLRTDRAAGREPARGSDEER